VLAALLPLLTAGILTGGIGGLIGVRAAGSAIALAFMVAHLSILGWPPLPPGSSLQKIVYIAAIGLLLGVALDFLIDRVAIRPLALIWPGLIVAWLGWQRLLGFEALELARLILVWLAGALIFDRLLALRDADIVAPTMVLVAEASPPLAKILPTRFKLFPLLPSTCKSKSPGKSILLVTSSVKMAEVICTESKPVGTSMD